LKNSINLKTAKNRPTKRKRKRRNNKLRRFQKRTRKKMKLLIVQLKQFKRTRSHPTYFPG
jgi:hypothetical protein